jgi:hypothetical protein
MVVRGNLGDRVELRRKRRQPLRYTASILIDERGSTRSCSIFDISHTGARLLIDDEGELPDKFILLLNRNGEARRICRLVWRDGKSVGVAFQRLSDEDRRGI